MLIKTAAAVALLAFAAAPVWAVNKCTIDGQTVFQDAPCPGKGETLTIRPASGAARPPLPAATGDYGATVKKPMTEAQRLEANVTASQKERRLRELTEREVPRADQAVRVHLLECKNEQARLEAEKGRYVQNLYGKTDAAQRAAEQAAAAARCDTRDRDLRADLDKLRAECQQLGGCK